MRIRAPLLVLLMIGCAEDETPPALPAAATTSAISFEAGPSLEAVDDPTLTEESAGSQDDAWTALATSRAITAGPRSNQDWARATMT